MKVTIYDLPNVFDNYTVVIERGSGYPAEFYGMSINPLDANGFNLYLGDSNEGLAKGKHLGKRVAFEDLERDVKVAITKRIINEA